jgi:hypothetical protein
MPARKALDTLRSLTAAQRGQHTGPRPCGSCRRHCSNRAHITEKILAEFHNCYQDPLLDQRHYFHSELGTQVGVSQICNDENVHVELRAAFRYPDRSGSMMWFAFAAAFLKDAYAGIISREIRSCPIL